MRTLILIGVVLFCLVVVLLCLPPVVKGQGWPQWGARPWMADTVSTFITVSDTTIMRPQYKPANWWPVWADGGLAAAITAATAGDGIIVYADTLTDEVTVTKKLYFKSAYPMGDTTGGTVWQVDNEAFLLKAGGAGCVFEGFEIKSTSSDSLFRAYDQNYTLRNCILDCSTLVASGELTQNTAAFPYWENVKVYPRQQNGIKVIGDTLWCVNFQCNEPLFYDKRSTWGVLVQGSPANSLSPLWHCRGKTNIYSKGTAVGADSDGVFCAYDGAIIATDTNSVSAVSATKGGSFVCYGGEIVNNHHDKATVNVTDSAAVNIEKTLIKNKDTVGSSFTSVSTIASQLVNCTFGGQIVAGTSDIIDYKMFNWGPVSIANNDSSMFWSNTYGTTCYLEYIVACNEANNKDTLLLREKTGTGVWDSHIDTLFISDADTTGIFVGTIITYSGFDDASIAAGNTLWLVSDKDGTADIVNIIMKFIPSYRAVAVGGD